MAGVIALITTTAGFAAIVSGSLVVADDARATANNILAHESLYRLAIAGDVIASLYIAYTLLLYNLFRQVNRSPLLTRRVLQPRGIRHWDSQHRL